MKTIRSSIAFSTCAALLAGCAHPARVSDSVKLKDEQGVIVYRMSCGPQVAWVEFYRSGQSSAGFFSGFNRAGALLCQEGVQTQRVKAGRYFIGKIGYTSWIYIAENEAMTFVVTPGKLNYIGHIGLPSSLKQERGRILVLISDPVVRDKSAEAEGWLNAEQGSLRRYEFTKALAQAPAKVGEQRRAVDQGKTP